MTNELEPITSEREYRAALKELKRLWGAASGTRDGDRLESLAGLIDAYEAEHEPMQAPDPVDAIMFRIEQERT